MGILEIPEKRRLIIKPPTGKPTSREALVETTATKSVMPSKIALKDVTSSKMNSPIAPTVEVSSADTTVVEATFLGVIYI